MKSNGRETGEIAVLAVRDDEHDVGRAGGQRRTAGGGRGKAADSGERCLTALMGPLRGAEQPLRPYPSPSPPDAQRLSALSTLAPTLRAI